MKAHESPGLCFKLFILSRKGEAKLKLVLTQKFFVQVYTHFGPAVKKVKTERVDQIDAQFCVCELNVPPLPSLDCFRNHSYIHSRY